MRISDWSSDVCSSDLTAPSRLSNLKRSTDRASSPARHSPRRVFLCQSLQLRPSLTLTGSNDPVNPDLVRKKIMARTARKNDIPTFRSIAGGILSRSEEHTSELQSLMRISYAVFCLKKKKNH